MYYSFTEKCIMRWEGHTMKTCCSLEHCLLALRWSRSPGDKTKFHVNITSCILSCKLGGVPNSTKPMYTLARPSYIISSTQILLMMLLLMQSASQVVSFSMFFRYSRYLTALIVSCIVSCCNLSYVISKVVISEYRTSHTHARNALVAVCGFQKTAVSHLFR